MENQSDYIRSRVDDQINWFDHKSKINKCHHYALASVSAVGAIVASSSILVDCDKLSMIVSLFVAVAIALDNNFHFQQKWMLYRSASEELKGLKYRYEAKDGDWKEFVDKVEDLLEKTQGVWKIENFKNQDN